MGYFAYLKELIAPMLYYDLDSGLGSAELDAEGEQLDSVFEELLTLEREAFLVTAEDFGLTRYEDIVPARPLSESLADRRAALRALLLIDGCGFTIEALNTTLRGCGINVVASEAEQTMTVNVSFPSVRGVPDGFEELRKRIEQILPCHLNIEYVFSFADWVTLEIIGTWANLEAGIRSWAELESYYVG